MVLVTGASGFVGSAVLRDLSARPGLQVVGVVREAAATPNARVIGMGNLTPQTDWTSALRGTRQVIHCAARVHVMHDAASDPLAEFRRTNVDVTTRLARDAARSGVKRFIFLSSVKVHGEATREGRPFREDDSPDPVDPYGVSKMEAEQQLRAISDASGMELVIIRPPLVYGPGVKGNFRSLVKCIRAGVPLPLGAVHNRRSMVALMNLVDLIAACVEHTAALNTTFLVSDAEDLSTTELLRRLGDALNRPARLIPVPASVLELGAILLGRRDIVQRLLGSLQVDITHTRAALGWRPPVSVDEGLRRVARESYGELKEQPAH